LLSLTLLQLIYLFPAFLGDPRVLFGSIHPSSLRSLDRLAMGFIVDPLRITTCASIVLEAAPPGFPALSKVALTIALEADEYSTIQDHMNEELARLDQLFASTSDFPSLHTVSIDMTADTGSVMDEATTFWLQNDIRTYLPLVAARQNCTLT
jgi:hypothetical protein